MFFRSTDRPSILPSVPPLSIRDRFPDYLRYLEDLFPDTYVQEDRPDWELRVDEFYVTGELVTDEVNTGQVSYVRTQLEVTCQAVTNVHAEYKLYLVLNGGFSDDRSNQLAMWIEADNCVINLTEWRSTRHNLPARYTSFFEALELKMLLLLATAQSVKIISERLDD